MTSPVRGEHDERTVEDRRDWVGGEAPFVAKGGPIPKRPNIVFIFADDLGWGDLGCYGSLHNNTPHLDRLASQGVRFSHAYAASATCSPTRIAFYTGRYPGRLIAGLEEPLTTRDEHHGIPHEHSTLPSLLRDSGYRTAMFGKWHCGWLPWFSPLRIGFDTFFGNLDGAMDYFSHIDTAGQHDLYEGETEVHEVGYYTELVSERAADFIRSQGDEPFYLQVNYTAPHWPWEGPNDQAVSERVTQAQLKGVRTGIFHYEGGSLATYQTMVAALDDGVARVLHALEETGQADNTIVIFTSDNGGERYAFLWPFVGEKGDLEEGGIRVPTVMRWPAALAGGMVSDAPIGTMDWTATLLAAAGVSPDDRYPLDGINRLPWLITGAPLDNQPLFWRTRTQGAVRDGRWKLLFDREAKQQWSDETPFVGPRARLFDITVDGREWADLSYDYPDVRENLLERWHAFDQALLPYPTAVTEPLGEAD